MAKFLPQHAAQDPKFYNRMLPTMPVPVETIQSAEITPSTTQANNTIVVGSNPCAVPVATLSARDLRLRGSSFIRSHASKHGLPNASRKLMKEVIELLKSHYAVVHQVTMLEDDFGDTGGGSGGGKIKKKASPPKAHHNPTMVATHHVKMSPTMVPQRPMSLVPFQVQMPHDQALFSQVASIVDRLPVDRRLHTVPTQHQPQAIQHVQQQAHAGHIQNAMFPAAVVAMVQQGEAPGPVSAHQIINGAPQAVANAVAANANANAANASCSSRILARTRGELTSFGTSLLRPEAAAHKVHNSSRKPKHVVIDELWRHYTIYHSHELMATTDNAGCIGNVMDDDEEK